MLLSRSVAGMLLVGLTVLGTDVVSGQDYPSKPIRILAGQPGGSGNFTARTIGQGISGPLGQPVVIDNRSSLVSPEVVAKSPPDGYTLLVQGTALLVTPLVQKLPFDVVRDFAPISQIEREVFILVVHPSVPAKSVKELIALAKARPGDLNYASGFGAGPSFLSTELFKSMTGLNMVRVPYKGNAASMSALASGEVQILILDAGLLTPFIKSGKMRALAVTSATPSALAPGLPTVAASGVPGYETVGVGFLLAPIKTPADIINRLNREVVRFLNTPDAKEKLLSAGQEVVGSSPEQCAATIKSEIAKWSKLIKEAGIKVERSD